MQPMATFSRVLASYQRGLKRHPVITNAGTAASLFAIGDLIAQHIIQERLWEEHDYIRTIRLATYGGCIFAPLATAWYAYLAKIRFGTETKTLLGSVAMDQFLFTPTILAVFFTSTTLLEGKGVDAVQEKIKHLYVPTLLANLAVWIPVQAINFAFVPAQLRLLVVNVVALGWNTYLSYASALGDVAKK